MAAGRWLGLVAPSDDGPPTVWRDSFFVRPPLSLLPLPLFPLASVVPWWLGFTMMLGPTSVTCGRLLPLLPLLYGGAVLVDGLWLGLGAVGWRRRPSLPSSPSFGVHGLGIPALVVLEWHRAPSPSLGRSLLPFSP